MHERLIESWLDSASERTYQGPFAQILLAKGYRVLHLTRHCALEEGKDIIALSPRGHPVAYQLKGNPGSRLSKSAFRKHLPQVNELISLPIVRPGCPQVRHDAVIVTNGDVEEEVQRAVNELSRECSRRRHAARRLSLITRGEILADALTIGQSLWPQNLDDLNVLLHLLVSEGKEQTPYDLVHKLLLSVLPLDPDVRRCRSAAELRRQTTSAALLLAIALKSFDQRMNHVASLEAWVMFCTYAIGASMRTGYNFRRNVLPSVRLAVSRIQDCLSNIVADIRENPSLVGEGSLVEGLYYRARITQLAGLMASGWFMASKYGWEDDRQRADVEAFLIRALPQLELWGEAAIPSILLTIWALSHVDATVRTDVHLCRLLEAVISRNKPSGREALPNPYHRLETVLRHNLATLLQHHDDPLEHEKIGGTSYFAESILHLVVRRNLKQTCKFAWPDFSQIGCRYFVPEHPWSFCLLTAERGHEEVRYPGETKSWDDLATEAREDGGNDVPPPLRDMPELLSLALIVLPHRATGSAIRFLGRQLEDTWH